ncbi:MAG: PilZ domain-containing protein [Pseudomonadales bacterium]
MRLDRIDKDEEILVDIISCESDPELQDVHVTGRTVDVSEEGMKVTMTVSVPEKTHLGLRLNLDSNVFRLEGDVRWTRRDGQVFVGVMLDPESADYEKWTKMFDLGIEQIE